MHIVKGSGMVIPGLLGIVKNWLLPDENDALFALVHPGGPATCDVGADADAVRGPSLPDTSARKLLELKG